jgi:hypothetical protein
MTVASISTASPTIPIPVITGGTAGDREGWAEQAAQNGSDWSGVSSEPARRFTSHPRAAVCSSWTWFQ